MASIEHDLVSALKTESETLQNITDHFMPMMKRFCVHFFWEQDKTDLKYSREYIVASESAAPTLPDTERAGIPANHSNMVKFGRPTAPGFRMVVAALRKYTDEAPGLIPQRLAGSARLFAQEREQEALERIGLLQPLVSPPSIAWEQRYVAPSIQRIEDAALVSEFGSTCNMRDRQLEEAA
jgi:hypothetical protein